MVSFFSQPKYRQWISRSIQTYYRLNDLFWETPAKTKLYNLDYFNYTFNKGRLRKVISWSLHKYGHKKTVLLLDELKRCGYEHATQAGISLGIDDLKTPQSKHSWLMAAQMKLSQSQLDIDMGYLNRLEYSAQIISTWNNTNDTIKNEVISGFQEEDMLNPVYMMAFSGARGNISQVRQLAGMRGLMSDPNGDIITYPIESNFREGLTLTEYIISCYGARKGVVDTALRTATSGYLTRRLVDVVHHVIIHEDDCLSDSGICLTALRDRSKIVLSLQNRLIGRVLSSDIYDTSGLVAYRNQEIDKNLAEKIVTQQYSYTMRSPLTCQSWKKVCQKCYGWSLVTQQLVPLGECVGVIAAQSIGEPGTQLTMRTFHTGGVFSGELSQEIRSLESGQVRFDKMIAGKCVRTQYGQIAFCTLQSGEIYIGQSIFTFPAQTFLFVKHGQQVLKHQVIGEKNMTSDNKNTYMTVTSMITGLIRFAPNSTAKHLPMPLVPLHRDMYQRYKESSLSVTLDKPPYRKEFQYRNRIKPFQFATKPSSFWVVASEKQQFAPLNAICQTGDLLDNHSSVFFYQSQLKQKITNVNNVMFSRNVYWYLITHPVTNQKLLVPDALSTPRLVLTQTISCSLNIFFLYSQIKKFFIKSNYFNQVMKRYHTPRGFEYDNHFYKQISILPHNKAVNKNLDSFYKFIPSGTVRPTLESLETNNQYGRSKSLPKQRQFTWMQDHYEIGNRISTVQPRRFEMNWAWTQKQQDVFERLRPKKKRRISLHQRTLKRYKLAKLSRAMSKVLGLFQIMWLCHIQNKVRHYGCHFFLTLFAFLCQNHSWSNAMYQGELIYYAKRQRRSCTVAFINNRIRILSSSFLKLQYWPNYDAFKVFLRTKRKRRKQLKQLQGRKQNKQGKRRKQQFVLKKLRQLNIENEKKSKSKKKYVKKTIIQKGQLKPFIWQKQRKFKFRFSKGYTLRLKRRRNSAGPKMNYYNLYGWIMTATNPVLRHQNQNQICGHNSDNGAAATITSFFPLPCEYSTPSKERYSMSQPFVVTFLTWWFLKEQDTSFASDYLQKPTFLKTTAWLHWAIKNFKNAAQPQVLKNYFDFFNYGVILRQGDHKQIWATYVRSCALIFIQYGCARVLSRVLGYLSQNGRYLPKLLYKPNDLCRLIQKPANPFYKKISLKSNNVATKNNLPVYELNQAWKALFSNQSWLFPVKFRPFLNITPVQNPLKKRSLNRKIQTSGYAEWSRYQPFPFSKKHIQSVPINQNYTHLVLETLLACLQHSYGEVVNEPNNVIYQPQRNVARYNPRDLTTFCTINVNHLTCYTYQTSNDFYRLSQYVTPESKVIFGKALPHAGQVFIVSKDYTILRNCQFYRVPQTSLCNLESGQFVYQDTPLLDISYKTMKANDIVQGIPKVERLFEARSARNTGLPQLFRAVTMQYLPMAAPTRHKEIMYKSLRQIQIYIINAIQIVYQSQGVNICDKHLEVIIKQMTCKVKIINPRLTGLLPDDLVYLPLIDRINNRHEPAFRADHMPCILGITKASLQTHGFLSAASFQETVRVLGSMTLKKRRDYLVGLKENLILGYILPCGTHYWFNHRIKHPLQKYGIAIKPIVPKDEAYISPFEHKVIKKFKKSTTLTKILRKKTVQDLNLTKLFRANQSALDFR